MSTLDRNAIFAKWLQKKLVFKTDAGDIVWADTKAWGPERQILTAGAAPATGKFYLYAPDAVTLIATSPSVTIRAGDMWQFNKD